MWYLINRIAQIFLIMAILSIALFGLLSAMPGNPVDLLITSNPSVKPEDVRRLKKLRGLDKPWYIQYFRWIYGYYDENLPPKILPIDKIVIDDLPKDKELKIDLSKYFVDPNFVPREETLRLYISKLWPLWEKSFWSKKLNKAISNKDLPQILFILQEKDPNLQSEFFAMIEKKSSENLTLEGLFGVKTIGHSLVVPILKDKIEPIWFVVTNAIGQQQVGKIEIISKNNSYNFVNPLLILPKSVFTLDDDKKIFSIDLKNFIKEDLKDTDLTFVLSNNQKANLSKDGALNYIFDKPGQSVISFIVYNKDNSQKLAFAIDHGIIENKNKFNKGFLYFLTDPKALGFSQTYKRPVHDLLFGELAVCGDGKVDPGETCDLGNKNGFGVCLDNCFRKNESFFEKADAYTSGLLVSSGRIGNTIQLMLPSLILSLLLAIPLGIFSAYRQYSILDYLINFLAFIGISLPVFWFAIMMMYLFAEIFNILPAGGVQTTGIYGQGWWLITIDRLKHALLPTAVLSIVFIGRWLRYMRASMLEVLPQDYIRTARAKGLSETKVILKHAFRNALIPVVTVLALSIPTLFGGAVLTETVFSWPGVGRLQYEAVMNSDYYVAIVVFLASAFLVMIGNLVADILYLCVDPRLRKN